MRRNGTDEFFQHENFIVDCIIDICTWDAINRFAFLTDETVVTMSPSSRTTTLHAKISSLFNLPYSIEIIAFLTGCCWNLIQIINVHFPFKTMFKQALIQSSIQLKIVSTLKTYRWHSILINSTSSTTRINWLTWQALSSIRTSSEWPMAFIAKLIR